MVDKKKKRGSDGAATPINTMIATEPPIDTSNIFHLTLRGFVNAASAADRGREQTTKDLLNQQSTHPRLAIKRPNSLTPRAPAGSRSLLSLPASLRGAGVSAQRL